MLTAFFRDFPAGFTPGGRRGCGCGRADVGAGVDGAVVYTLDGVRRPLLGVLAPDFEGVAAARRFPVLFRVLGTGRAGRATFGGPFDGRDGRGSVVVMAVVVTVWYPDKEGGFSFWQVANEGTQRPDDYLVP